MWLSNSESRAETALASRPFRGLVEYEHVRMTNEGGHQACFPTLAEGERAHLLTQERFHAQSFRPFPLGRRLQP